MSMPASLMKVVAAAHAQQKSLQLSSRVMRQVLMYHIQMQEHIHNTECPGGPLQQFRQWTAAAKEAL